MKHRSSGPKRLLYKHRYELLLAAALTVVAIIALVFAGTGLGPL